MRLGSFALLLIAFAFAQGCACGPCGGGCKPGGCGVDALAADQCAPACGGCGHCIQCRRWGALQAARDIVLCHNGCGDLYYDEWFSDPPAPRDPCDYCYCPGPLRQIYWNLVALHPMPRCAQPLCGDRCAAGGCGPGGYVDGLDGDYLEGDYGDGDVLDGYPVQTMPAEVLPPAAPNPMRARPPMPSGGTTIEKAQRPRMTPYRTTGLQFVPHQRR